MKVFKQQPFKVGEREFVTMAAHDKEPGSVRVWVQNKDGGPVVVTTSKGSTATLSYTVTMEVKEALEVELGINTVDRLMKTAEADIRDRVEQGWA